MTLSPHSQEQDHAVDRLAGGRDHRDQVGPLDLRANLGGGGMSPGLHDQRVLRRDAAIAHGCAGEIACPEVLRDTPGVRGTKRGVRGVRRQFHALRGKYRYVPLLEIRILTPNRSQWNVAVGRIVAGLVAHRHEIGLIVDLVRQFDPPLSGTGLFAPGNAGTGDGHADGLCRQAQREGLGPCVIQPIP